MSQTLSVLKLTFIYLLLLDVAFGSDADNPHLPHNHETNQVVYTGTHDNTTLRAWLDEQKGDVKEFIIKYLGAENTAENDLHLVCIRTLFASVADTVIIPIQDYLGLGESARINTPGTLGENWKWRLNKKSIDDKLIGYMSLLAGMYSRKG